MRRGVGPFTMLIAALVSGSFAMAEGNPDQTVDVRVGEKEEFLIPDGTQKAIEDFVAKLDLRASGTVDFLEQDWGGFFKYTRRTDPSYKLGFTTLTEIYDIGAAYHPDSLSRTNNNDTTFGVGAGVDVKVTFARQFQGNRLSDKVKTFLAVPYTPFTNLPWNSQTALNKLKVGDFVALEAFLNLVLSANQFRTLAPHVPASLSAYYMLSGNFQIHVYRVSADSFRIKVIGIRGREAGLNFLIGYTPSDDFQVSRVDFVDRLLRRGLHVTALAAGIAFPRSNLFMVDYLLNLKDQEVRDAYDKFFRSATMLKTAQMINPVNGGEDSARKALLLDASPFEDLYERNKDKDIAARVVDRMFRGSDDMFSGHRFYINVGPKDLLQFNFNSGYSDNHIVALDRNNRTRYFYLPVHTQTTGYSALANLFNAEEVKTANMLFETDANKDIKTFGELSFFTQYRNKNFSAKDIRRLKAELAAIVPKSVYDQIDWGDWLDGKSRTNGRMTSLLVLRPQALKNGEGIRVGDIYYKLSAYLKTLKEIKALPMRSPFEDSDNIRMVNGPVEEKYAKDIELIAYSMAQMFDPSLLGKERSTAFATLRGNALFDEVGAGFIVSTLGTGDLADQIYFETTWTAKDSDTVQFIHGNCRNRRLYKSILYIYNVLNNRSIDLRLVDDSDFPEIPDKAKDVECEDFSI